jgi:hypothetical protein
MTETSVPVHDNADDPVADGPPLPTVAFEVRRAPGDPASWVFTITQPAIDADVDPRYLATGDAAAAAIAAFCAQQLAGLGVLPQDVARMIYDRIPLPPSETP